MNAAPFDWSTAPPAARAYRDALPPGEVLLFPIAELDRTGIPTWKAVFFADDAAHSVHNGLSYGATDTQALTGALGELAESVHAHDAIPRLALRGGSYRELRREMGSEGVVHPWRLCLPAGSAVDAQTPLRWVSARRYPSGDVVWIPLDVVAVAPDDAPGYLPFTTPITNGLGAGPTLSFALAHGVQELLQRDGNGVRFRALDAGIEIDCAAVSDPVVRDLLDRFARAGIEPLVKFADDEFGIANVYAVGAERPGIAAPLPVAVTAAGEAASPSRDVALRKALLEFGAARVRKMFGHGPLADAARVAPAGYLSRVRERVDVSREEPRALQAMLRWLDLDQAALLAEIADPILRVRERRDARTLPDWQPGVSDAEPGDALARELGRRLARGGLDVLYVDFTTPQMAARGVAVVKAIVPGLEVETMSYHRIGERNARKLLAADSPLVARIAGPRRERIRMLPDAEERLGGPLWLDVAAVDAAIGPLYALYREPDVHAAPLARETTVR